MAYFSAPMHTTTVTEEVPCFDQVGTWRAVPHSSTSTTVTENVPCVDQVGVREVAVPHTEVQERVIGYQPTAVTTHRTVGVGHASGRPHILPWHRNRNVDVVETSMAERPVFGRTAVTHMDVHNEPVLETHMGTRQTTTTTYT
eukprot:TRINITY_DN17003_c0_g1_i1.p2 TRINITY_DN17003_c0_g1~~TRINITY_DN17003_c0_g1_i1.p2  ORF type:complete len:143 (-),score=21.63 TRINITY_DN17003_c0_g1_i1:375-803(-)